MPEVLDPPKPSFSERVAAARPADKKDLEAGIASVEKAAATPPPEPPKPDAKGAATPPPDPDEEIIAGKRTPRGEDFKRVKTAATAAAKERDELKVKLDASEKELGEHRKAPKHNGELIKQLESERDDIRRRYEAITLEMKPEFHQEYATRVTAIVNGIKSLVPEETGEKLAQLLQAPDGEWKRKALAELTEELDAFTIAEISAANREVQRTIAEKQTKLADSHKQLSTIAEERQKKLQARQEKAAKAFDAVISKHQDKEKGIPVYQLRDGDSPEVKAHNAAVAERIAVARAVFSGEFESDEDRAEAAIWAASAQGLLADLKAAQAENAQIKETLAKVQGSAPNLGPGGGNPDGGGVKKTFTQRLAENAV